MLSIVWRKKALSDLTTIIEYIADRNLSAAARLHDDIEHAVSQLPQHPYLYRHGRVLGTREIVVHPNYIIVYRTNSTAIEILNVLHTRQQYP